MRIVLFFLCWGFIPLLVLQGDASAGISYTEYVARGGLDREIENSVLAIAVEVKRVEDTANVRDRGYFSGDDTGPYIKTKERKVSAYCVIKRVVKNESSVDFSKHEGDEIVATFWKQIEGPPSPHYREAWQTPPKVGDSLLMIFLKDDIEKTASGLEFLPTFVHGSKVLDATTL